MQEHVLKAWEKGAVEWGIKAEEGFEDTRRHFVSSERGCGCSLG